MSEPIVIQCPTCSKKFKLPAKPPAVFTCTQCQTPMDLSAFREAAAATKPTKQEVTGGLEGARSSRLAGRGARARLRRSRDGGGEEEGGDEAAEPSHARASSHGWRVDESPTRGRPRSAAA